MNSEYVLNILQERQLITDEQANTVRSQVADSSKDVAQLIVDTGAIDRNTIFYYVAESLGLDHVDLKGHTPPAEVISAIPAATARLYKAVPVSYDGHTLTVALADPSDHQASEEIGFALSQEMKFCVADSKQVLDAIERIYVAGEGTGQMNDILGQLKSIALSDGDEESEANSAPIVRYIDLVLEQAMREQASDIHFEPFEDEFKIRYRVDGALYEMSPPPAHLSNTIISRIKVMSNLNIAERRIPQDGRMVLSLADKDVDFRVSTLPTAHGESVVLRVLDRSSVSLNLENLGLPSELNEYIEETIVKPNGIFICTGPTGAGKTTTLYACLREINTIDSKLLTAEDPVEYDVEGIIQVPVNESIGLTFSRVLRAFLRQDPDRILVGEMRDVETAQIAIQASLTGHLVFSTLHTNDAPGAVTRLVDMGCEPFLVAASLEGVLGQRLLRTICDDCRQPYEPSAALLGELGLSPEDIGDKSFFTGGGCEECGGSGYRGRQGLFELLDISEPIAEMITDRAPTVVLRQKAIELGMTTLREDGLRNIYEGNTTIEEVLKYT
ncbi:MAG: ATPase, T2SS/T4P/T4SS family [Verrucomicrobiota bacterium]|nr:pilus assembly protein PilB [Verrucomicrobiales bacterium]MEC7637897.1 ATPase, T2SS/T4P/T4SS family [Verrucomicrobiota bacterium]|tara:strand:+ start:283 stop:1950 length:1668 start_codon:yes stop_codon:yes gene_type:complete